MFGQLGIGTSNGTVKAWGDNDFGQLGDGSVTPHSEPGSVARLAGVEAIAAGNRFSLALLRAGTVRSWGLNVQGQIGNGNGNTTDQRFPVAVTGLPGRVTAIAAGSNHALALLANGTVMAWGSNFSGQLGQGAPDLLAHPVPLTVSLPGRATSIGTGLSHSLAVLADGSVRAWGLNNHGQVGTGNTVSPQPSPVAVVGLTGVRVKAVDGGFSHTLALLTNGRVKGWGSNASGQLGDGTFVSPRLTPVDVLGLTGVTAVGAGSGRSTDEGHSLAIARGVLMSWGLNTSGQLGTGPHPSTNRAEVVLTGIDRARSISAGEEFSLAS